MARCEKRDKLIQALVSIPDYPHPDYDDLVEYNKKILQQIYQLTKGDKRDKSGLRKYND